MTQALRGGLPGGVVTGVGAVNTVDPVTAARLAVDETSGCPHVPELPLRGPWAEPVGRLAAVLVDLPVELEVGRWRLASGGGRDLRRARSLLSEDLDAVEEQWRGFEGAAKLQLLGPLSAAATIELRNGDAAVSDAGALRDLTDSLVEGLLGHLADLRARVPGAAWAVQLDEPVAAAVTRGQVVRPSGWGAFAALPSSVASGLLSGVVQAAHETGAGVAVHCCDPNPDWDLLTGSGADALSVPLYDASTERREWADRIDRWWAEGRGLWAMVARPDDEPAFLAALRQLRSALGADAEQLDQRLVLTPSCAWAPAGRPDGGRGDGPAPVGAQAYAEVRALASRLGGG